MTSGCQNTQHSAVTACVCAWYSQGCYSGSCCTCCCCIRHVTVSPANVRGASPLLYAARDLTCPHVCNQPQQAKRHVTGYVLDCHNGVIPPTCPSAISVLQQSHCSLRPRVLASQRSQVSAPNSASRGAGACSTASSISVTACSSSSSARDLAC
jgi:hypothetical protein